jgi:5-hydroxyisourate hydrolase
MPGVSIHVVDVSRGKVAQGMRVSLIEIASNRLIADGLIGANGLLDAAELAQTFAAGVFEARFYVSDFFAAQNSGEDMPFLDVINYRFGIASPQEHYHLPMKLTPWGYSCFRGGA